ncbi:hypothetical protein [Isoptericola dokdonensis]|uniref:Uncharacterized protein n=1 Tax=Isoptericola dokdonensis DS-3 TaxID=1300344 RepID=A0A168F2D2_9MICO|nr:hypothetical protein [Isoptericola dokdonensis]ANC30802.1 hypothetical protein I598_1241 [Isoptericola dokdonensis DS-3]
MASTTSSALGNLLRAGGRAPARRRQVFHPGSVGMLTGALLVVVGSLLPWVVTPFGNLGGTAGPGLWTLCAGFIALAGALLPRRWVAIWHAVVAGGTAGLVVGWQLARLVQVMSSTNSWGQAMPGIGLVMVGGGAVVLLATAVRLVRRPAVAPGA